jgi:uncharacterized phage-like protein YoqJ
VGGYNANNPTQEATRNVLTEAIRNIIDKYDEVEFISGMAIGVDTWAAEVVLQERLINGRELTLAIPFVGQQNSWPIHAQLRWLDIYHQATTIHFVDEEGYAPWKLLNRNKWMVDNSDLVIAVWNGDKAGGTFHCIDYAKKKGKEIINLWPEIQKSLSKK